MEEPIKLGISACLLGEKVRYDGGHALDPFIVGTLGRFVEFVPVCPEVEFGLSVPREPMRLVGEPDSPRLMTIRSRIDYTDRMLKWAKTRAAELESENLCGFIFKSKSPSSGMERVKVYNEKGIPSKKGVGLFARAFMEHFPLLPVEEEGRLHDPQLRENFIERIFVFKRWRDLRGQRLSTSGLVAFHTRHKLLVRAHSLRHVQLLGKLVAEMKKETLKRIYDRYEQLLMDALALKTSLKKNTDVLMHIMGYFKKVLSADEKQELLEIIDHYRTGNFPLVVPITLLNHYVRKYDEPYLKQQYYLNPHPVELKLRNHV